MNRFCDLCGLPLRPQTVTLETPGKTLHFCCMGCRQVYAMLLESSGTADPKTFKSTEIYKTCQAMGIIPRTESDLEVARMSGDADRRGLERREAPSGEDLLSLQLSVDGMWCPACAWIIEDCLKKTGGVSIAACNFSTDRVRCQYDPVSTSPDQLINRINSLGYRAHLPGEDDDSRERKKEWLRFIVSAFFTVNIMMLSFTLYTGFFLEFTRETIYKLSFPIFIMASIVLFYGGRNIYHRAWMGITSHTFSMEALITVGSFCAYLFSTVNLFLGSIHLYYDTASMLITLVLLGKALEKRGKRDIREGLEAFYALSPTKVRVCTDQYPMGRYAAADHLRKGDIFRVEEKEIFPADGLVLEGRGTIDESSLTGEAEPVPKASGDRVKSGTGVLRGTLKVRAESVGDDSTLGQMMSIMERALGEKTPLETKTDRALQWFVPAIFAIAIGTAIICLLLGVSLEESFIRLVTVMVIACPCTLGIAVPLARVAGITLAGKQGVLVRDFNAFEQSDRVNHYVFDKTGTVTTGNWTLRDIITFDLFTRKTALGLAASLEKHSDHFIATEINRQAEAESIAPSLVDDIKVFPNGISGQTGPDEVKIGSRAFLADAFVDVHLDAQHKGGAEDPESSFVYMGIGGRPCALFIFGDSIKDGAFILMKQLRTMGYPLALISGDDVKTTEIIGRRLGIKASYGGKLPEEKLTFVARLQKKGDHVAMVGDGINDAPALAQADLAIAVHSGSPLGKETSDITLMRGDPAQLLDFILLAKRVNKKVGQNLFCSFFYNAVSIPIAVSGLLNPLIAVTAMLLSSLSVIGNTLLLVKKKQ